MTWSIPGDTDPGPVRDVAEGMHVVDVHGQELGTVTEVRMSDPEAVTGQGQQGSGGTSGLLTALMAGPAVPDQVHEQLVRLGYLVVRGGALSGNRYVTADHVAAVTGDRVQLDVGADALLRA